MKDSSETVQVQKKLFIVYGRRFLYTRVVYLQVTKLYVRIEQAVVLCISDTANAPTMFASSVLSNAVQQELQEYVKC